MRSFFTLAALFAAVGFGAFVATQPRAPAPSASQQGSGTGGDPQEGRIVSVGNPAVSCGKDATYLDDVMRANPNPNHPNSPPHQQFQTSDPQRSLTYWRIPRDWVNAATLQRAVNDGFDIRCSVGCYIITRVCPP